MTLLMVISPAKTLDFSRRAHAQFTVPNQLEQSQELIEILRTLTVDDLSRLMNISDKLATLNHQRYQTIHYPFTTENAQQALLVFKGDVYKGICVEDFSDSDLEFSQQHLRILSGLYGILRPLDLIQPYRLEMGTKLATHRGKNLYEFWSDQLSKSLNADFEAIADDSEQAYLVNLASNEYFKAIVPQSLKAKTLNLAFKENKSGTYKIIGIHAKRARGLMVNFVVKQRIQTIEPLKTFAAEGYRFNENLSKPNEWVFCRD